MALEDLLAQNTAAIEKQNTLLEQLLSKSGAPAETKAETKKADTKADEPKEDATAEGPTYPEVKKQFAEWLGEHPKGSEESKARSAYLKGTLFKKLGIAKLDELDGKTEELSKLVKWLETKAKTDIAGHGEGLFAAPASEDGGDDEGDL